MKNSSTKPKSHGLAHKRTLPRITWFTIFLWKVCNSVGSVQYYMYVSAVFSLNFTKLLLIFWQQNVKEFLVEWLTSKKSISRFSPRVSDTGCWLLLFSFNVSINNCLLCPVIEIMLDYWTLICFSGFTVFPSWLSYFLSLIILYLRVNFQSMFYKPVSYDFHWLLDPSTCPPLE